MTRVLFLAWQFTTIVALRPGIGVAGLAGAWRTCSETPLPLGGGEIPCPRNWRQLPRWLLLVVAGLWSSVGRAQVDFEQPPIAYMESSPDDPVSRLQERIQAGELQLAYDEQTGYLKSVLEALAVPISSQALVFSKTSFQLRRISPRSPRALYFDDEVYVGWVPGGDVIELSAVDPQLGANFYTLSQQRSDHPEFRRNTHQCLQCHGSSLTKGVPGHLVRSVYTQPDGQPIFGAGTYLSDHSSPLKQRWGGWYVTGEHGSQRHLGNLLIRDLDNPRDLNLDEGANTTDLTPYFRTSRYLSVHSDIVALMVLEHQTMMQNLITRANFLTRAALHDAVVINEMLGRPADYYSESTKRRVHNAAEPVVQHLLFCGETRLTEPISGTSGFTAQFSASGRQDGQGRSLRQFDLRSRLFKFPCSYVIHSRSFDRLPAVVKDRIYRRLWEVLIGEDTTDEFQQLTADDRQAILEILRDTKTGLPAYWR